MKNKEADNMMNLMYNNDRMMNIAARMAEDVGAPELRNPLNSGMMFKGILARFAHHRCDEDQISGRRGRRVGCDVER